jgi:hypothetical protein
MLKIFQTLDKIYTTQGEVLFKDDALSGICMFEEAMCFFQLP